jgi:transcriptional regulator with XRE-family HTH domain
MLLTTLEPGKREQLKLDIGLAFRKLRISNGYSQQFIAQQMGVSRNAYIDWESNRVQITVQHCSAICEFYSLSLSQFFLMFIEN